MMVAFPEGWTVAQRVAYLTQMAQRLAGNPWLRVMLPDAASLDTIVQRIRDIPYVSSLRDEIETMPEQLWKGTDCKGKSVLLGSWLARKGVDYYLRWIEVPSKPQDHLTVRLKRGDTWLYADPTFRIPVGIDPRDHLNARR